MIGLYILFCFCQQLKNTQSFFQLRCMRFSQAVFNSNSSCDLLPCDSHSVTGNCQELLKSLYRSMCYEVISVRHSHGYRTGKVQSELCGFGGQCWSCRQYLLPNAELKACMVGGERDEQGQGHQAASVFPGPLCDMEGAVKGGESSRLALLSAQCSLQRGVVGVLG